MNLPSSSKPLPLSKYNIQNCQLTAITLLLSNLKVPQNGMIKHKYINVCYVVPVQWLEEMIPRDIHRVSQDVLFEEVESMSSSLWVWCQAAQHLHVWHKQQWWQQVSTPTYKLGQRRLWQGKQNATVISWLHSTSLHKKHSTNIWESCKLNPEADSLVGLKINAFIYVFFAKSA